MECISRAFECQEIIKGIFYGLISAFLFTSILFFLRTKLRISSKILFRDNRYRIKVVNVSYLWKLFNVKAELSRLRPDEAEPEETLTLTKSFNTPEILILNRKCPFCTENNSNTYKFGTDDNLRERLREYPNAYFRLRLTVTNSFTNFIKVYERKYYFEDIINGSFIIGSTCEYKESQVNENY
jgi:hypothetical protein